MNIQHNLVMFNIPFAFKDPEDIRKAIFQMLREELSVSARFTAKHGDSTLYIIVVHEGRNKELKVLGPATGNDFVEYAIWLPYRKIKNSPNYRKAYLNN